MTALSAAKAADFTFLLNLTGLTKGNLSSHLQKLEEGGMLETEDCHQADFRRFSNPFDANRQSWPIMVGSSSS